LTISLIIIVGNEVQSCKQQSYAMKAFKGHLLLDY